MLKKIMTNVRKDKKIFRSTANRTNRKNNYSPRGGIRF